VGEFSRSILKEYPKATVYAFDIQEEMRENFIEFSRRHANIYFYAKGFSRESGMSSMVRTKVGDRKAHLGIDSINNVEVTTVDIEMTRLSLLFLNLLKIDTEGEDLKILEGASKSLAENRIGFILFEVLPILKVERSINNPPKLEDFTLFLRNFGYTHFYRVSPVLGFIKVINEVTGQRYVTNVLAAKEPLKRRRKSFGAKFLMNYNN
jgi:FkbM family methyltransferase